MLSTVLVSKGFAIVKVLFIQRVDLNLLSNGVLRHHANDGVANTIAFFGLKMV
jgi:hypothetical protein